jgi:hypothetical protein
VPPNSGLFICPEATPIETEADAIAGIFMDARPLAIPLNDPYLDVSNIGAGWGVQMTGTDLPIVVPKFHFLRMILVCQQESATPGPGAGSVGRLRAMVVIQDNVRC